MFTCLCYLAFFCELNQQSRAPGNGRKCHLWSCEVNLSQVMVHNSVLGLLHCGPADRSWAKFSVGRASLQPTVPSQAKPRVALPVLNVAPRAEGHQPAVQSRSSALLSPLLLRWEQQEGREHLLLLIAFTDGHTLSMVVSECLLYGLTKSRSHMVKSSLGMVKCGTPKKKKKT